MYRLRAIIINITRIRDNQTRIVMVTREYGKITGWWNKKNITGIDLGDIIEVFISRDGNKNTIKNLDIVTPSWDRNWNYNRILAFLETLHIVNKMTIEGNECISVYEDTVAFIEHGKSQDMTIGQYSIFQMRILKSLGSMDREALGNDPILGYIYDHISHTPLERILTSSNIKTEQIHKIQQINLHSLYMLER